MSFGGNFGTLERLATLCDRRKRVLLHSGPMQERGLVLAQNIGLQGCSFFAHWQERSQQLTNSSRTTAGHSAVCSLISTAYFATSATVNSAGTVCCQSVSALKGL